MKQSVSSSTANERFEASSASVKVCARIKPIAKREVQSLYSSEEENGKTIIACQTPPQHRLVANSFRSDQDVSRVISDVFDCRVDVVSLDAVFSAKSTQEIFYRKIAKRNSALTADIFQQKKHVAVLLYGPSRSGKTYTLAGDARHEKGLLFRCGEDLLNRIEVENAQNEIAELNLSIFCVHENELYDLLREGPQAELTIAQASPEEVNITGLTNAPIKQRSDFKLLYATALKQIQALSESVAFGGKHVYETSHIVVQFQYSINGNVHKLSLVRLADTDYLEQTDDDFEALFKSLSSQKQDSNKRLIGALQDIFNPNTAKVTFVACVSAAQNQFAQSLFTLDSRKSAQTESEKGLGRANSSSVTGNSAKTPVSPSRKSIVNKQEHLVQTRGQQQQVDDPNSTIIDFIVNEAEAICSDIHNQTPLLGSLSQSERARWIDGKSAVIVELQQQLRQQPYSRDVPYCETLMKKCLRSLRFAGSSPVRVQQLNASQVSQRFSNSNEMEGFVRDKEEKVDKDFMRLLDRYSHKKDLVSQLGNMSSESLGVRQSQANSGSALRSFVEEGRSQDEVRSKKSRQSSSRRRVNGHNDEAVEVMKDVPSSINNNNNGDDDGDAIENEVRNHDVGNSLQRLQETLEINNIQAKKKISQLRAQNREIKASLKEHVEQCRMYAGAVESKEREVESVEYELRQAQQDILLNMEAVKEFQIKEAAWLQMEAELRSNALDLKAKLARKKNKLSVIKEKQQAESVQYQEQARSQEEAIAKYENQIRSSMENSVQESVRVEDFNTKINEMQQEYEAKCLELEKASADIESVMQQHAALSEKYCEELGQKAVVQKQVAELERINEQQVQQNAALNAKIVRIKAKYTAKNQTLAEEHSVALEQKKQKATLLKENLANTAEQLHESENKRVFFERALEEQTVKAKQLQNLFEDQTTQKQKIEVDLLSIKEEKAKSDLEQERLQNLVAALEQRNKQLEATQLADAKTITEVTAEVERQRVELTETVNQLQEAQEYIQHIKQQNETVLAQFDEKIEEVIESLRSTSDENAALKTKDGETKKLVISLEEQLETYKEKYMKVKHANKSLIQHNEILEKRLNECVHELQVERSVHEQERHRQIRNESSQKNKLKVIGEIQSMIQAHKSNLVYGSGSD